MLITIATYVTFLNELSEHFSKKKSIFHTILFTCNNNFGLFITTFIIWLKSAQISILLFEYDRVSHNDFDIKVPAMTVISSFIFLFFSTLSENTGWEVLGTWIQESSLCGLERLWEWILRTHPLQHLRPPAVLLTVALPADPAIFKWVQVLTKN